ncbi:MAG: hypothetical protein H6606_01210 [Flavobacteriales bacterium]|nr:hypothetical protein [Flavobacteriales bacterium]
MKRMYRCQISAPLLLLVIIQTAFISVSRSQPFIPERFEHLIVGNQNDATIAARDIYRDSFGFVWIATYRGLARFDGNAMKLIEFRKPGGIDYGRLEITRIAPWGNEYIAIATARKGVFLYRTSDGDFRVFDEQQGSIRSNNVIDITISNDQLWVSTGVGVDIVDLKEGGTCQVAEVPGSFVTRFAKDISGRIWFSSPMGLTKVESYESCSLQPVFTNFPMNLFAGIPGLKDFCFEKNRIWILGGNDLVLQFDPVSKEIVSSMSGRTPELPISDFQCIFLDRSSRLWIGSRNGLALRVPQSSTFKVYTSRLNDVRSLAENHVTRITEDGNGNVFVLLYNHTDYITPYTKPFNVLFHKGIDSLSPLPRDPLCAYRDSRGTLWMGSSGLSLVKKDGTRAFLNSETATWEGDYVMDIIETSGGDLFFTSSSGLARLRVSDYDELKFVRYPYKDKQFSGDGAASYLVTDLFWDGADHIWMATANGISRFHIPTESFESFRDESQKAAISNANQMNCILKDRNGNVWIGTRRSGVAFLPKGAELKGANLIWLTNDPTSGESISNDAINDIFEDRSGNIWIATAYGLNLLKSNTSGTFRFKRFGREIGWQTEVFTSVNQDKNGYLWIGTLGGLYRFDPNTSDVRHFVVPDGMPSDGIMTDGIETGADGLLYVSCRNAVAWFDPIQLMKAVAPPSKPILTSLALFNREIPTKVRAEDNDLINLDKDIAFTSRIKLKHDQNVLTLSFTGLDILNVQKQRYKYRMAGFDEEWQDAGYTNTATYTNLDPGEYKFEVMASNGDGIWSGETTMLTILISPPWYQTTWAYILFGLAAMGLIWIFIRTRIAIYRREMDIKLEAEKAVNKARMDEREIMRQKNARDFHDETGLKLTRINLLTTTAKQNAQDEVVVDCLDQIEKNARDLTSGMRDFVWALDPKKDSLTAILQRLQDLGNNQFEYLNSSFKTHSSFMEWQDVELDFDAKLQVLMIFKEAINNCIKYSKANEVVLECKNTPDGVAISLVDDGVGFDISMNRESYGLKNMLQRAHRIGARLHVRSTPGSGTMIQLVLPNTLKDMEPQIT